MLYIIGLTLVFIFGIIIGREYEKGKQMQGIEPLDIKLTNADLGPEQPTQTQSRDQKISIRDMAILYNYGGPDN